MKRFAMAFLTLLLLASPALAVRPDEMLANPVLEARARALSSELRCLVCQNENIDDSNADLAHDLRVLVRERLKKGDTDQQVLDFLVSRYGQFVLLKPRFERQTLLLWITTPAAVIIGLVAAFVGWRRRQREVPATPLSAEEKKRLSELLGKDGGAV